VLDANRRARFEHHRLTGVMPAIVAMLRNLRVSTSRAWIGAPPQRPTPARRRWT
jgi:hypothetical protein